MMKKKTKTKPKIDLEITPEMQAELAVIEAQVAAELLTPKKKNPAHYVDNVALYAAMKVHRLAFLESETNNQKPPRINEYIGKAILDIANNLARKGNFANYSYKDDMIMTGVENCVRYINNFDPERSKSPFSYFTQILYFAFVRTIQKEKKNSYVKFCAIKQASQNKGFGEWMRKNNVRGDGCEAAANYLRVPMSDVMAFERKNAKTKSKKPKLIEIIKPDVNKATLEDFQQ